MHTVPILDYIPVQPLGACITGTTFVYQVLCTYAHSSTCHTTPRIYVLYHASTWCCTKNENRRGVGGVPLGHLNEIRGPSTTLACASRKNRHYGRYRHCCVYCRPATGCSHLCQTVSKAPYEYEAGSRHHLDNQPAL